MLSVLSRSAERLLSIYLYTNKVSRPEKEPERPVVKPTSANQAVS